MSMHNVVEEPGAKYVVYRECKLPRAGHAIPEEFPRIGTFGTMRDNHEVI